MGSAAVFIDGGYFDRLAREYGTPRLDFARLGTELAGRDELFRVYFYHCLPYLPSQPSAEDELRVAGKQRFFNALTRLPRFQVRLGKLEYRGQDSATDRPIFEQKRVDIQLGVDLVLLAVKQRISRAVLVTGDSEFLPVVRAAKNEGVVVHLFHGVGPLQPHRDLWEEADDRTVITSQMLHHVSLAAYSEPSASRREHDVETPASAFPEDSGLERSLT